MKKDNTVRIGDRVKIIHPHFFVRCGYPMSLESSILHVNKYQCRIENLLKEIINLNEENNYDSNKYKRYINSIKKEYARAYLEKENFGGDNRIIETIELKEHLNEEYLVMDKRVVRTGTYIKRANDYPAELINQKSHVILELDMYVEIKDIFYSKLHSFKQLRIESCNVEKLDNLPNHEDNLLF